MSRFGTKTIVALLLALGIVVAALPGDYSAAQGANVCVDLMDSVVTAAQEACGDLAPGEVCFASAPAELAFAEGEEADFAESGDVADVSAVESITTGAADPAAEEWGVAVANLLVDLPADGEQAVNMILFGEAELASAADAAVEPAPTLTLTNIAGYDINLRAGAGTTYATIGTLENGAEAVVDGRNANGDWYRIQTESGPAWAFRDLVSLEGDAETLNVLADDDLLMGYTQPMQAFTLTTSAEADAACGSGSSGLLVQSDGENTAHFQINGVDVSFSTATLLIQAAPDAGLQIMVLDGSASVAAEGTGMTAEAGTQVQVELDDDGMAAAAPELLDTFSFAALTGAPVSLLSTEMVCTAGVLDDNDVAALSGPGEDFDELVSLDPASHYTVTGQLSDDDGGVWLQLQAGQSQAWVPEGSVNMLGSCGSLAQVSAPTQGDQTTSNQGGNVSTAGSFVPAGQSVWMANTGVDHVSGTCTGPELALCSHLVAISPNPDGSINWRGQEPLPYVMQSVGTNSYYYQGRNHLNNGNLELSLTFTGDSTWEMTMTTIFDSDAACNHVFYYTATRNW